MTASCQQNTASLLKSVMDASAVDSVRNEQGCIVDFRFRLANQAFLRAAHRTAQQLMDQSLLATHPHLLSSGILERYVAAFESEQPQQLEQVIPDREGQRWLSVAVLSHGDGLVISFTDINALKQTQQQLEEAFEALKQSNVASSDHDALSQEDSCGYRSGFSNQNRVVSAGICARNKPITYNLD